jgi:hypothetical protein
LVGDPGTYTHRTVDPAAIEGVGQVYWKEVAAGEHELFTRDEDSGIDIVQITDGTGLNAAAVDHGGLAGLADDDHAGHLWGAGRAGGQVQVGGTAASETLTLRATSNATDGAIIFETDPTTEVARLLVGGGFQPGADDGGALGASGTAWSDVFLATGAVIDFNAGAETITHSANTLTFGGMTLIDIAAGIFELNDAVRFDTGVAMVAATYSIGRDADGTNQLHFNVPTGATFEFSVNDAAEMTLSATAVDFQNNSITTTGGGSLTGTWTDLGTVSTVDIDGGTVDGVTIGGASAGAITGTTITANTGFVPDADDGAYLGVSGTAFSDLFLASGAVINFNAGDVTLTHAANTLTVGGATLVDVSAGILELNDAVRFDTGVAIVAATYSIGRDADGTNQLHFNVPTGATFEWSVNDVVEATLSATAVDFQSNSITTTGGGSLTGTWTDLGTVSTVDIDGGTVDGVTIGTSGIDLSSNTLTGTAAEFDTACSDDDFAYVSDNLSVFAATTSAQLAGVISDETGSSLLVFNTSPTLVTPDINGGTVDSLTALSIRSTGAAFDLTFATATVFTAGRTLTVDPGDSDRTVTLSGNPTLADWFNQDVKSTASPTFVNLSITSFATGWTNAGRTVADLGTVTTADIDGGTVDGVTIGGASAGAITGTTITANTGLVPDANDGAYLGVSGTAFSDLFLASGAVINFNAGDITATHSANLLAFQGGDFVFGAAAITQASFVEAREDQNATTEIGVYNITSGTAARSGFLASAGPVDNVQASVYAYSAGFTASAGRQASEAIYGASGSQNPNAVLMTFNTGVLRFVTDGIGDTVNSERAQINKTAFQPGADDRIGLGVSGTAFSDLFLASGAVINFNAGDVAITHSANTLTFAGATLIDVSAGILELNDAVRFDTGVAIVAATYSVGRDADGTNQLHFNVPTGATFEFSVNDVAEMTLSASAVNFQNNSITTTGGGSLTGTWTDLGTVSTVDIDGGTVDGVTIGGASAGAITGTTITANTGIVPDADDGAYLGQSGTAFSDLFLASGAVVNFNAGDVTLTHSANLLTLAGGNLSATLTTPTIADFTNATHNHTNAAGGGLLAVADFGPLQLYSDQLENPNSADWTVNALAAAEADDNNAGLTVRAFDDTTEEGVGFTLEIPAGVTNMTIRFRGRARTGDVAARTVGLKLYNRGIPDNAAVQAWTAGTALTDIDLPATTEYFQYDEQTISLATLSLTAGEVTQFELTRVNPAGGTELTGDYLLHEIQVEWS